MLEGYHFQNAYVTRNVDKWVEVFHQRTAVDSAIVFEASTTVMTPSGPGLQSTKLAFIWVGDLQYELIQPLGGAVSVFEEALPSDESLRFHHICMRLKSWEDFRARVDQQPYPVVLEGGDEALRFLYLDARPFLGHHVEYTCMNAERWGQIGGNPALADLA